MPRKPNLVPTVQNFRGYARVRVNGKYKYLGAFGSPEADEAYKKILAELLQAKEAITKPLSLTVAGVCERFSLHAEKEYAGKHELYRLKNAMRVFVRILGEVPAADLRIRHLKQLQEAMASGSWLTDSERAAWKEKKRPLGWSGKVVNRQISRIRFIWRWAEEEEIVPPGSLAHLRAVRPLTPKDKHYRRTLPVEPTDYDDLMLVIKYCPSAVAVMLQVQWWAGMRSQEIRIIRTCDIDRSGETWLYRPETHKNEWRGQERVIALGPKCQTLLEPWLKPDRPEEYLFLTSQADKKPYTESSMPQSVRRACARAGVSLVPYGGRHAAKTRIALEHGDEAARQILGQKSIEATSHYGKLDSRRAAEIAKDAC